MSGSELLSKQRRYNIGEYKNLNRLTANTVTVDYLKFGMDISNVTITYPEDLINDGYTLVLPKRPGISGEFLGIDDSNKLKWGNPNVINNIHCRYGTGLNTAVIDSTYTKGQIIFPENYEITITPTSRTSKLLIQFRCAYNASFSADTAITFYIYKTINNDMKEVQVEANFGTLNATGSNRTQYITSTIIDSETTDPIKISIAFAFNNIINIPAQAYNIGILGQEDYPYLPYNLQNRTGYTNYKNSIIVTDFEGSGAHSTLLSKSHDNESIYYNLGTLFLGSNFNSLNTNNRSSLSLIAEQGISAPLLLGELQGNITSNYVITDNISCLNFISNVIDTNILNGNIITSNIITTYDISINNSLKTKDLDVFGNLHVHGRQTIVNSEILNIDDNIIIVNADGNIEKQAGIQANIDGNLYDLFFDISLNGWSIYNKNLHLNKLLGNNISLTENITAQWLNGNINSNFVNVTGNININDNYILDVSAIKFSDGIFFNNNILNENIDTINSNITSVWGNITTMKIDISNNAGNITILFNDIDTIHSNIISVCGNITILQSNVSTLQTVMNDVEGNIILLQANVSSLQNNINQPVKNTSDVTFNSLTLQKDLLVQGNLTVKGNKTEFLSVEHYTYDNIITLNADGNVIKFFGIEGNVRGNIYSWLYDICNNSWTTKNNNLTTNKLIANVAEIDNNLKVFGDIELHNNYILDVSAITFKNGSNINGNSIPYIHTHLDNIYANLTLIGNTLSSVDNSITHLQSNIAIIQANIITLEGNIINLQNQIDQGISSNSNVIFYDISANGSITVNKIISSNAIFTNDITVTGNLSVLGSQTILNSTIVEIDDNIIIVNADGELLKEAGLTANIGGNLYNFVFDICSNSWTTQNNNLSTNKLIANIIEISGNVTASWFNGNLSGTNAILRENVIAKDISLNGKLVVDKTTTFNGDSSFNSNVNILGNLTLAGSFNYSSDKRLKKNNIDIINGIALIKKLKPQIYDKRNKLELDNNNYYIKESGIIAQDIEEIEELKHLINKPKNIEKEPYTINYIGLIAYNIAATKELDNIVEEQKIKINSQENRIQMLENKLLSQERVINELIIRIEALEKS